MNTPITQTTWYATHIAAAHAAIDALDTKTARWGDTVLPEHVALVKAIRDLMPTDDSAAWLTDAASEIEHARVVAEEVEAGRPSYERAA